MWLRKVQLRKTMNSHKIFEGKTKKILKTDFKNAKHAFFATELSHEQVARVSRQTP